MINNLFSDIRDKKIYDLRSSGMSFDEVAKQAGVSPGYAQRLYRRYRNRAEVGNCLPLAEIVGIGYAKQLYRAGITTREQAMGLTVEELHSKPGIGQLSAGMIYSMLHNEEGENTND